MRPDATNPGATRTDTEPRTISTPPAEPSPLTGPNANRQPPARFTNHPGRVPSATTVLSTGSHTPGRASKNRGDDHDRTVSVPSPFATTSDTAVRCTTPTGPEPARDPPTSTLVRAITPVTGRCAPTTPGPSKATPSSPRGTPPPRSTTPTAPRPPKSPPAAPDTAADPSDNAANTPTGAAGGATHAETGAAANNDPTDPTNTADTTTRRKETRRITTPTETERTLRIRQRVTHP